MLIICNSVIKVKGEVTGLADTLYLLSDTLYYFTCRLHKYQSENIFKLIMVI